MGCRILDFSVDSQFFSSNICGLWPVAATRMQRGLFHKFLQFTTKLLNLHQKINNCFLLWYITKHSVFSLCKYTSKKQFQQILHACGGRLPPLLICMRLAAKQLKKNGMCGRQSNAKFACAGGHNTAKQPVFCNDARIKNIWENKIETHCKKSKILLGISTFKGLSNNNKQRHLQTFLFGKMIKSAHRTLDSSYPCCTLKCSDFVIFWEKWFASN